MEQARIIQIEPEMESPEPETKATPLISAKAFILVAVIAALLIGVGVVMGTLLGLSSVVMMTTKYEQACTAAFSKMDTLESHHFMERH